MTHYSRAVQPLGDSFGVLAVLEHFCGPALPPPEPHEHRYWGLSMHRSMRRPWAMALLSGVPILLTAFLLTLLAD